MSTRYDEALAFRDGLRRELSSALRARRSEAVAALRTAIAAIDNAQAVELRSESRSGGSESVAYAASGVGSTEAARRELSMADVRVILRDHVDDYLTEADRYESLGQTGAAQRLRAEADTLRRYL